MTLYRLGAWVESVLGGTRERFLRPTSTLIPSRNSAIQREFSLLLRSSSFLSVPVPASRRAYAIVEARRQRRIPLRSLI